MNKEEKLSGIIESQIEDEVRDQTDEKKISCCNASVIAGRCSDCKENCY